MRAQSGPQGVTVHVEFNPGPFGMNVPLNSSAQAGLAKPTAALATIVAVAMPTVTFMLAPFARAVAPLFAGRAGPSALFGITGPMPPEVANHAAAVALVGEPSITIGPLYASKTIQLCVPDDPVCTIDGMVGQAANFVMHRL
jgi:Cutinase